jgi:hypothetical protein
LREKALADRSSLHPSPDRSSPIAHPSSLSPPTERKPTLTNYENRRQSSFHRSLDHLAENALTPPVTKVTTLTADLTTTATTIDTLAAEQSIAFGTVHGAVVDRKRLKEDLIDFLKGLGDIARTLDPAEHPGIAAEMRLGNARDSYSALLARARGVHTVLVDAKAAFVEYGAPASVDTDLQALIDALAAASERKNEGKATHIGGGAGIAALCKSGVATLRKLDAILSRIYKDDPVKLASWKAARRMERAPKTVTPADPGDGSGSTGGGESTPPPASGS